MKFALRVIAAAALLYAGYVHLDLASNYDGGGSLSIGNQFRAQFAASVLAALVLLVPRKWAWLPAMAVAGATAAAVVASVYFTVGPVGPLPALPNEPWYAEKAYSAIAEGVTVLLGLFGLFGSGRRRRGRQRRPDLEKNSPSKLRRA